MRPTVLRIFHLSSGSQRNMYSLKTNRINVLNTLHQLHATSITLHKASFWYNYVFCIFLHIKPWLAVSCHLHTSLFLCSQKKGLRTTPSFEWLLIESLVFLNHRNYPKCKHCFAIATAIFILAFGDDVVLSWRVNSETRARKWLLTNRKFWWSSTTALHILSQPIFLLTSH